MAISIPTIEMNYASKSKYTKISNRGVIEYCKKWEEQQALTTGYWGSSPLQSGRT